MFPRSENEHVLEQMLVGDSARLLSFTLARMSENMYCTSYSRALFYC